MTNDRRKVVPEGQEVRGAESVGVVSDNLQPNSFFKRTIVPAAIAMASFGVAVGAGMFATTSIQQLSADGLNPTLLAEAFVSFSIGIPSTINFFVYCYRAVEGMGITDTDCDQSQVRRIAPAPSLVAAQGNTRQNSELHIVEVGEEKAGERKNVPSSSVIPHSTIRVESISEEKGSSHS